MMEANRDSGGEKKPIRCPIATLKASKRRHFVPIAFPALSFSSAPVGERDFHVAPPAEPPSAGG